MVSNNFIRQRIHISEEESWFGIFFSSKCYNEMFFCIGLSMGPDPQNDIVWCTLLRHFQQALNNLCILIPTQIMPNWVFWPQMPKYGNSAQTPEIWLF